MKLRVERLQPLGRALMLPIAVLPIAALLLRIGQADMFDLPFVAAAGNAIFSNLGLLFAAGVAVGLARENHGAAGLAGVVMYMVATEGAKTLLRLPPDLLRSADLEQAAWRVQRKSRSSAFPLEFFRESQRGCSTIVSRTSSSPTIWPFSVAGGSFPSPRVSQGSSAQCSSGLASHGSKAASIR